MKIPFYFDYACPWAYLGSSRVEPYFSGLDVEIDYRPVRLAGLAETKGEKGLPPGERKQRWYLEDLRSWAEMIGAPISLKAGAERPSTKLLLCAAIFAQQKGVFNKFHPLAYKARWVQALRVDEVSVVRDLLKEVGLDPDEAVHEVQSEFMAQQLVDATNEAIERGVFGVPTLFVGERMFFGNDRFELARHFIINSR